MRINNDAGEVNPFHYALNCIGGKWKMILLHKIYTHDNIRFNQLLRVLPLSEKVLSQQLKELVDDGLVARIVHSEVKPPSVEYNLTEEGRELIPSIDLFYLWSLRRLRESNIPINNFDDELQNTNAYYDDFENSRIILEKHFSDGTKEIAVFEQSSRIGPSPRM